MAASRSRGRCDPWSWFCCSSTAWPGSGRRPREGHLRQQYGRRRQVHRRQPASHGQRRRTGGDDRQGGPRGRLGRPRGPGQQRPALPRERHAGGQPQQRHVAGPLHAGRQRRHAGRVGARPAPGLGELPRGRLPLPSAAEPVPAVVPRRSARTARDRRIRWRARRRNWSRANGARWAATSISASSRPSCRKTTA